MSLKRITIALFTLMFVCLVAMDIPVQAKVSKKEADRLKKELTPLGAERAGNEDGSIPAWTGGLTGVPDGISYDSTKGRVHPNPFNSDKALYTITTENMEQHADKFSDGIKGMFKKYPGSYKMTVYQSRRSAAAPQWVYDNTYENAQNGELAVDENAVAGICGGVAFPIPKDGRELIYNHLTRWEGTDSTEYMDTQLVYGNGSKVTSDAGFFIFNRSHYYDKEKKIGEWDGWGTSAVVISDKPPRKKGEILLTRNPLNFAKHGDGLMSWQYFPGQRRVRRSPTVGYDTPNPSLGGLGFFDEGLMFAGSIERFDWKIIGKKELLIPYNNYQFDLADKNELLTPFHINPDYLRWELHRVWILQATLKEGYRHAYGRRLFYLDEDTWSIVLSDNFDTRGVLWRTSHATMKNFYDQPVLKIRAQVYYDLRKDSYCAAMLLNDPDSRIIYKDQDDKLFTPQSIRKLGKR